MARTTMTAPRRWRLPLGLRFSLALAMVPLLALPPIGLRFVEVMAEFARNERLENQGQAARNLAASLHDHQALFDVEQATLRRRAGAELLPVELLADVVVDQDAREWIETPGRALPLRSAQSGAAGAGVESMHVRLAAARSQERPGRFFLLIDADDERLVLPQHADGVELAGDRLIVESGNAPDAMLVREVTPSERPGGWIAEIEFDAEPRFLRVHVVDVDYLGSRRIEGRADSGLLTPVQPLSEQARDPRSALWADAVRGLARASGRVSVFDSSGALLVQSGAIAGGPPPPDDWQGRLARRLLAATVQLRPARFEAFAPDASSPDPTGQSPLSRALAGFAAQQAERTDSESGLPAWLLTSAQPVWSGDRVVGALVVEEHTGSRLGTHARAIERLTLLTAAAMAASALALLAVGSVTVARIVRLRGQAERTIDSHGRVVDSVREPLVADEIGALAQSYASVLERLRQHQQYVGNLRSRLVHELRTPIMVVRSSLENLAAESDAARADSAQRDSWLARARDGTQRLERIVASMGEASSLESMLADSELETVDLVALLRACVEGYRDAFAPRAFELDCPIESAPCPVVPEAIAQALDKLVSNAVDFAEPGSAIVLSLRAITEAGVPMFSIAVRNRGPALPAAMRESLFDSMVSVREHRASAATHLGLGLYLVRLVGEFHGGHAFVRDVAGGVEAGFTLKSSEG
ncbi:MAG: ATP-binding protein [Burkholderiaceae bacterium]|nr:ATP-binding protein [Burkholderiaceae bacterium]